MRDDTAGVGSESTGPTWEVLEAWVRERAQALIQGILEEEVTELLGRDKSERKRAVDAAAGYRNGYGKPPAAGDEFGDDHGEASVRDSRSVSRAGCCRCSGGRDERGGRAAPGAVPAHGLAEGDFELAMRGLLGEGALLSKSSIRRLGRGCLVEEAA